jgi:uncharacterized protein YecT (DUF1311 family)
MKTALSQTEMHVCAGEEAKRVNAEMDALYRKLLARVTNEPNAVAKITAAQKAWTVYRDAYIEAMWPADNKQGEYGSMYPTEADMLWVELTRRQIAALQALLDERTKVR